MTTTNQINSNFHRIVTAFDADGGATELTVNLPGANVTGVVANASYAAYAGNANSVAGANVSGEVAFAAVANSVTGSNVSGEVANANYATWSGEAYAVSGANVSGEVAFAATANSVAAANVSGTVANANYAAYSGDVVNASQSNITSVGTLTGLTVGGTTSTTDLNVTGNVLGSLLPDANITYNLGSPTQRWKDIYLSNNTIYLGNTALSASAGNLTVNGNNLISQSNTGVINLGDAGDLKITGGSNGQVLSTDGTGNLSWSTPNASSSYGDSNVTTLLGSFGSNSISTTGNVTANNFVGNISITDNVIGTGSNVTLVAGSYSWTFDNTGVATFPGNVTTSGNFVGNGASLTGVAIRTTGSWTVASGTNTYSITVPINGNYQMWVRGNIPNGILVYQATVSVSNTNVPVLGTQRAWNYTTAGSPILLTTMPTQIVGAEGTISTASVVTTTANVFDFVISNTSGSPQTVYWGYVTL